MRKHHMFAGGLTHTTLILKKIILLVNYILQSVDVIGILVVGFFFFFSLSVYKNHNMCIYNEVISQKKQLNIHEESRFITATFYKAYSIKK